MTTEPASTLVEALVAALRACAGSADGLAPPAAVLWTDPEREWAGLRPLLRDAMPEFLELGPYAPAERRGPAIWLRCAVEHALGEPELPAGRPLVLYLPGVARQHLRAGEETPPSLRPLVELAYRGTLWLQPGGHDWTVTAFLGSPREVGLDVARDRMTLEALQRSLHELARTPLDRLRKKRLEASDFDDLLTEDVVRDLLRWAGAPEETRALFSDEGWGAFRNQCKARFGFDPGTQDPIEAGERLGSDDRGWSELWARFLEAPQAYPGVPELLARSRPTRTLSFEPERWPQENEKAEQQVRACLGDLQGLPHAQACAAVMELEREHGPRRDWVWARLGRSPMAQLLGPLAVLARHAASVLGGAKPEEIAQCYEDRGWQADAAALRALAMAPVRDEELVKEVVQSLLEWWLEESAHAFQRAIQAHPLPSHEAAPRVSVDEGGCLLFVDGLRYDVGRLLVECLEGKGLRVAVERRWAALPTVTATAKPAVSPVADAIRGAAMPSDFAPHFARTRRPVAADTLRTELERTGYQLIDGGPGDWPGSDAARGWAEVGKLDEWGHKLGARLAREIDGELERLSKRIASLLEAGWNEVRVVTDHGWLLLPGGLPRVSLPRYLTASRWARCGAISGASQVEVPVHSWHWNPGERFAAAPGIGCFNNEVEYAHGGCSIQECLIPVIRVEMAREQVAGPQIGSLRWQQMRCFFRVENASAEMRAELRLERASGKPVTKAKPVELRGETTLLVEDDAHEQADLVLVLLAPNGSILAQRRTKVGASS